MQSATSSPPTSRVQNGPALTVCGNVSRRTNGLVSNAISVRQRQGLRSSYVSMFDVCLSFERLIYGQAAVYMIVSSALDLLIHLDGGL